MEHAKMIDKLNVFVPDQVASVFGPEFLDAEKCRSWILKKLHPRGSFCPHCGTPLSGNAVLTFWQNKPTRCQACEKTFTARTGTILSGKKLSFQEIILMSFLMAYGAGNIEISMVLKCTRETVRLWRQNFNTWAGV